MTSSRFIRRSCSAVWPARRVARPRPSPWPQDETDMKNEEAIMDHPVTEVEVERPPVMLEPFATGLRLRRKLTEVRSYGYRPTPARLTGQQLLIAQLTAL